MPVTTTRRPAIRSLQGWATVTLLEAGAIVECESHGWMLDRGDPYAATRARLIARDDPPPGICASQAIAAVEEVLRSIGDSCPDCSRKEDTRMPRFK